MTGPNTPTGGRKTDLSGAGANGRRQRGPARGTGLERVGLTGAGDETARKSDRLKDLVHLLGEPDPENEEQSFLVRKAVYVGWAIIAVLIYFSLLREILSW